MRHEVSEKDLWDHLQGEMIPARKDEMDRHVEGCARCRSLRDGWVAAIEQMRGEDPRLESVEITRDVLAVLAQESSRPDSRRRLVWVAAAAVLIAFAGAGLRVLRSSEPEEFRAKGAPPHSETQASVQAALQAQVIVEGRALPIGSQIPRDAELSFTYSNGAGTGHAFLMVFAVDARGEVRWYYPAFATADTDPAAITIESGVTARALPDAVRHELPTGPLWIYALFLSGPMRVSEVEARVARVAKDLWLRGPPPALLPSTGGELESRIRVEVR